MLEQTLTELSRVTFQLMKPMLARDHLSLLIHLNLVFLITEFDFLDYVVI